MQIGCKEHPVAVQFVPLAQSRLISGTIFSMAEAACNKVRGGCKLGVASTDPPLATMQQLEYFLTFRLTGCSNLAVNLREWSSLATVVGRYGY